MRAYDWALRVLLVILVTLPAFGFAQTDGSAPQSDGSSGGSAIQDQKPADASGTGAAPAATNPSTPAQAPTQASAPATSSSGGTVRPNPVPPPTGATPVQNTTPVSSGGSGAPTIDPSTPTPIEINLGTATADVVSNPSISMYVLLAAAGIVLAIIPFGFLLAGWMRKKKEPVLTKEQETHNRCFDIETLMKDKLRELTDLKAMAQEKTVEMGKELMRDLVTGTKTGDLLVKIEKTEEQYNKLKKLFEECQVDIDRYRYKGTLVENSLLDKEILNHVRIIRTRDEGDWKLHDIRLSKKQIEDIQKSIAETGWYFHLWEPGKDIVTVVFKDKLFEIKHSDKSTWNDAIAHGISQGIPKEQLDFVIV